MESKFIRPKEGRIIGGVCLGIADYFKIDVVIIRLIFVLLLISKGAGVLIYIILLIIMPEEGGKSYADNIKKEINDNDSHKIKETANKAAGGIKKAAVNAKGDMIFAYILIILGLLLILNNLFPEMSFTKSWPLLLVIIGIVLLLPFERKEK